MSEQSWTSRILASLAKWIPVWLGKVRELVFSVGRELPDPSAVLSLQADWNTDVVDRVLAELNQVAGEAWTEQSGKRWPGVNDFVDAQLQMTRNLLVRIPDEVYRQIFTEIREGVAAGESVAQIADRVDSILFYTGSEWWSNRSQVIANTETHRAWQAGTLAAALTYQPMTGPGWIKEWHTEMDGRERATHKRANGQRRQLSDTFTVGGASLKYPGDPAAPADEVINCRCDMIIKEAS